MFSEPNSIFQASQASQAQGIFSNCGPGVNTYEIYYNCKGPACTSLDGFENITCHTDEDGITCSNNVKCPDGISTYSSNFIFGQNQADPWNSNAANELDSLVQQQQNVAVSSCAKFSLKSDGTRDGTKVKDRGSTDGDTCPRVQETPIPMNVVAFWQKPSSMQRPHAGVTGMPQILHSNSGPKRRISKRLLLISVLIIILAMIPGAHASPDIHQQDEPRKQADLRIRDVSDRVKLFAQDFSSGLAEKVTAQALNGNLLAHNLVADVVSSVCSEHFRGAKPSDFTPVVIQNCVKSVYGGEGLKPPAVQFAAVFGASLLCDYVVSEAYPVAREFYPDGCDGLQEFARRIYPVGSATRQNDATMAVSQSSRSLVRESSTVQPTHSSFEIISDPRPYQMPTTSLAQTQVLSTNRDPTTYNPLKVSTTSRSAVPVSPEPVSGAFTLGSVSGILSTVVLKISSSKPSVGTELVSSTLTSVSISGIRLTVVSAATSSKSSVGTDPVLANQLPLPSNEESKLADTTRGLNKKSSSTSRSLSDMRSTTVPENNHSTSSQATLDFFHSSQATVVSGSQSPSFRTESTGSVSWILPDSPSMTSQYTTTHPRQTSPSRSSSRPSSRENETELSMSRSFIDPLTFSSNAPADTSADPPFDGSVRTTSLAKSSLMVDNAISSSSGNPRINGQSIPNPTSASTAQSLGPSSARPAFTSPNTRNMHEHSIIVTTPTPGPSWQVNIQSQDACPSVGCAGIVTETTHCDDCQSHSTTNPECHRGSCSSSYHSSDKAWNISVTSSSSKFFKNLPTVWYSNPLSLSSSAPSAPYSMLGSFTAPVYSGSRIPRSVSATNPAPSVLLVSQSLPSQSLPQKPTPVPKEAGVSLRRDLMGGGRQANGED